MEFRRLTTLASILDLDLADVLSNKTEQFEFSGNVHPAAGGAKVPLISTKNHNELYKNGPRREYVEKWISCPSPHSPSTYAMRVQGDAMLAQHGKSYPDGAIIFIDPSQDTQSGDRVIARLTADQSVVFKQLIIEGGKQFLRSLNIHYPMIDSKFQVLGKVIGKYECE